MVTHCTTNESLCCLITGDRTGSDVFNRVWSYLTEPQKSINISLQIPVQQMLLSI